MLHSGRHPRWPVIRYALTALRRLLPRHFLNFQNGRPPTTPLDCSHRELSIAATPVPPRRAVAELWGIEDYTQDSGPIWVKSWPVQVEGT
jgi:hypothetical protein